MHLVSVYTCIATIAGYNVNSLVPDYFSPRGERKCGTVRVTEISVPKIMELVAALGSSLCYIPKYHIYMCTCELWNSGEVQNGVNETKINGLLTCKLWVCLVHSEFRYCKVDGGGESLGTYPQLDQAPLTHWMAERISEKVRRHLSQAMVDE